MPTHEVRAGSIPVMDENGEVGMIEKFQTNEDTQFITGDVGRKAYGKRLLYKDEDVSYIDDQGNSFRTISGRILTKISFAEYAKHVKE